MTISPVLPLEPRRARADRSADRWITVAAIAAAGAYLVLGALSALLPAEVRLGAWLPIHLALAGATLTAIAGVMPFFTAALAAAPPAPRGLRAGVVLLVAGGIGLVAAGRPAGLPGLAVLGGLTSVAGLGGLVAAAFLPLRRSLATSRAYIWSAYAAAIVEVAIGISLAVADLAGERHAVADWALLKPAHAWLNVLGFVSLVIAATLVHFLPTIAGTRIVRRRALDLALVALAAGPAIGAAGFALGFDVAVRVGGLALLVAAAGLVGGVIGIVRDHGRWTTDLGWHRFTLGSLVAAVGWFVVAALGAGLPAMTAGASPDAWRLELVIGPVTVGWAAQAIVGSAVHLLPAIGPGDLVAHRRLRSALGSWTELRLAALNAGAALVTLGMVGGGGAVVATGLAIAAAAVLAVIGLALFALRGEG